MNEEPSESAEVTWEYYTGPGSVSRRRLRQDGRPKPHVCEVCDRAFDRPSALLQHGHTHTGERPHLCPVCKQKRFATTSNLYRHSRTCKGAKSDFIAVSYGERLLGAPQYGPPTGRNSDPVSDPALGNVVIRQRVVPTNPQSDGLRTSASDSMDPNSGVAATNAFRAHLNLPSPVITPKVEDDDSHGSFTLGSAMPMSQSAAGGPSSSPKSRAPPLFSARRPKPADMAVEASYLTAAHHPTPLPSSNTSMSPEPDRHSRTASPVHHDMHPRSQSLSYSQYPGGVSTQPTLPPFASFAQDVSGPFEVLNGSSIPSSARPPIPTNLKWADEARKTRRTTPLQKR